MTYLRLLAGGSATRTDIGHLVLRLAIAGIYIAHGANRLWGRGVSGEADFYQAVGIPMPDAAAAFTVYVQFFGGFLFALGLLTRLFALAYLAMMLGAAYWVHRPDGFFNENGGMEYPLFLSVALILLIVMGPGRYSLDQYLAGRSARAGAPPRPPVSVG